MGLDNLPLHAARVDPAVPLNRLHMAVYSVALLALFYRHLTSPRHPVFSPLLLIADATLAFMWALSQSYRWRPLRRRTFPDRLADRVGKDPAAPVPGLDVFICTADPEREPPVVVAGTVLSALAMEYPLGGKLSVYVSDDGGSELTLFALQEVARFARHWLPFCRDNDILDRAPEAYFEMPRASRPHSREIGALYREMKGRIETVMQKGYVDRDLLASDAEHEAMKRWDDVDFTTQDHPSVVEVVLDGGEDMDVGGNPLPSLVYVSREKRREVPHNFKAGALNALLRVSNSLTNAPLVLVLDCDMACNDPAAPLRALCYFMDDGAAATASGGKRVDPERLAFVQFPQRFNRINTHDIYNNQGKRLVQLHPEGMDGLDGPDFQGSGAVFSRRALSGAGFGPVTGDAAVASASSSFRSDAGAMASARRVAGCGFDGTKWGSQIGFRYGTLVEDYYTGLRLHCDGWTSVLCDPQAPGERTAFLGEAPISVHDALTQFKRWCVGLLQVGFSDNQPLAYSARGRISLLMAMAYAYHTFWVTWCLPVAVYGVVPQLALAYGVDVFPKASDPWFYLYCYLFLTSYAQDLIEFLRTKGTLRRWWNSQRIWMVHAVTCFPFAALDFTLSQLRISAPVAFEVTSKVSESERDQRYAEGVFEFGVASPFAASMGSFALLSLVAFVAGVARLVLGCQGFGDLMLPLFVSGFVVASSWPIYEAMVLRKDSGRMPRSIVLASSVVVGLLYSLGYVMLY